MFSCYTCSCVQDELYLFFAEHCRFIIFLCIYFSCSLIVSGFSCLQCSASGTDYNAEASQLRAPCLATTETGVGGTGGYCQYNFGASHGLKQVCLLNDRYMAPHCTLEEGDPLNVLDYT